MSKLPTLGAFLLSRMANFAFQTLIALGKKLLFTLRKVLNIAIPLHYSQNKGWQRLVS